MLSSAGDAVSSDSGDALPDAFLTKPVRRADLLQTILRVLGEGASPCRPRIPLCALTENRPPGASSQGTLRVLLAEDNAVSERLATRILEKQGYVVKTVSTGRAVLDLLEHETFDLILMDGQMPEMDGFEATATIRRREADSGTDRIPIIALTAYALTSDRERCLAAGMDDYLAKPIRPSQLLAAIERILAGHPQVPQPIR
jgi:CheY-like chemotaxis protein